MSAPRVAFFVGGSDAPWLGGLNYMRNLVAAVARDAPAVEPVLLAGRGLDDAVVAGFPDVEVLRTPLLDRRRPARGWRELARLAARRDLALERRLARSRIDVLSHGLPLGRARPIPTISWLPDLQHVRLPELFAEGERAHRDAWFRRVCRDADVVLLSSQAARRDLEGFSEEGARKSQVLRFVVDPGLDGQAADIARVREELGIAGPFIHLPNQFWVHKNHELVVEALDLLEREGRRVTVVATGDTSDYRAPGHFERLMEQVRARGLEESFRPLGRVAYPQLVALMRASVAVLNPSRFEGWSVSVEEAKSLGKRIVLSDIDVHVEQSPADAVYFPVDDAHRLAAAIWDVWSGFDPRADAQRMERAAAELPARRGAFARAYAEIARTAAARAAR